VLSAGSGGGFLATTKEGACFWLYGWLNQLIHAWQDTGIVSLLFEAQPFLGYNHSLVYLFEVPPC